MATRVRDPAVSRKNQILNAQRQAEWARQRLRMLMENMPPEELDEYIAASEEKEEPPAEPEPAEEEPADQPPATPVVDPPPEPPPTGARITGLPPDIVERIRAEEKAYVEKQLAERRVAASKDLEAQLREQIRADLRRDAGLSSHLDDLIEHTINCPPFADKYIIDGVAYHHGYTYTMRRALYDVLREQEARGWDSEDQAGNPNKQFFRRREMTMNPLLRMRYGDDGHAISRETTFSAFGGAVQNAPTNNNLPGGIPARGGVR